jgi:prevent-host-death family protein
VIATTMKHMERIGIRSLKVNASAIIRRVAAGEVMEVTDRGRPVARLVPWEPGPGMQQLAADGDVIPARGEVDLLDIEPLAPEPGRPALWEALEELRRDER